MRTDSSPASTAVTAPTDPAADPAAGTEADTGVDSERREGRGWRAGRGWRLVRRWRNRGADVAALATFGLLGWYLTARLWPNPGEWYVTGNRQDNVQLQWMLLHATRLFTHGENPLFTTLVNAPHGVNLMANTSILALALPLTPVTLAFGPAVSAAVLLALAPAATAAAWYHVISRHLVRNRFAAFVAGLFAGFAPAMVSHDTGHPNIVSQFALPYIVLTVLRLRIPGRAVRTGLELAGLVVLQVFINEEMLFLTALIIGLFVLAMLAFRPREVLPHVRSGLLAAAVTTVAAGVVLGYPLWWQFFGPMAYHGLPTYVLEYGADLASYPAYASESVAGPPSDPGLMSRQGVTEQNAFFGPLLLVLLAVIVVWLWRRAPVVRALAVTGIVLAGLSLGKEIVISGELTGVKGPWALLADAPLFNSVVPTRWALFLTPIIALLLAIATERALSAGPPRLPGFVVRVIRATRAARVARAIRALGPVRGRRIVRLAWLGALVAALGPIAPTPIDASRSPATPRFFTSGTWREHLPSGANVLPVPLEWFENVDVMQWQIAVDGRFVTPAGYYLAPVPGSGDRRARFGPEPGKTITLIEKIARGEKVPDITPADRDQARRELRGWRVDAVVMPDGARGGDAVRRATVELLGPGRHVDDVWLWDVRALTRR